MITLAELKDHLYLFDETEYDNFLNRILIAAQELAENYIGEYLSATTVVAYYPQFSGKMLLNQQFVTSVTSVAFTDNMGMSQTVPTARYVLDTSTNPVSVNLRRSQFTEWTTSEINDDIDNPVAITFSTTLPDTVIYDELVRHCLLYTSPSPRD